jgi:hypothetical protein
MEIKKGVIKSALKILHVYKQGYEKLLVLSDLSHGER